MKNIMKETFLFHLFKTNIFLSMNSFMKEIESNQKKFEEKIMTNLDKIPKENKYIRENMNIQNMTVKDLINNKNNYGNEINGLKFSEMSKILLITNQNLKKDMENIINILNNEIDANLVNEEITKLENETENKINALNEAQDNIIMQVNSV